MTSLLDLPYSTSFQSLPEALYSHVKPQGLSNPKLVCASPSAALLLDLDPATLTSDDALALLSGNAIHSHWQPIAMKYTGHQFGYYNPDLGDGRGLLLTEVVNKKHDHWDLHLKGAGLTPYSRQGDGRAVLRSSIREFLCSEALAALNIPTTRALCVVSSDTPVYREQPESGATLLRLAKTHIRFGHFEFCSFTNQHELLKDLCDHVIDAHYPDAKDHEHPYVSFFAQCLERTAALMAHWQSIGFAHGVMNTDNMSIIGDTFDFGPFAFLDDYDPSFICNHSDHQGRYAFNQQPNIANWNLAVLAQALLPLTDKSLLLEQLERFPDLFRSKFMSNMQKKLGLTFLDNTSFESIESFIETTLKFLAKSKMDYTIFFRKISDLQNETTRDFLRNNCLDINGFDAWVEQYDELLTSDKRTAAERNSQMNLVNPKYILRNYLAENAIKSAKNGDYTEVNQLHNLLQDPYSEQPEFESYAALPPQWGKELEISCSS